MSQGRLLKRTADVGLAVAMLSLPLLPGCTGKASQAQLRMLDDAQKRAVSAEADLNNCRQQRARLEHELSDTRSALAKAKNDRDVVKKALNE